MYEPKYVLGRRNGSVILNRRISQIGNIDDFSKTVVVNKEPIAAAPKLPSNFNRPQSKYKKTIYNNAVAIYVSLVVSIQLVGSLDAL